MFNHNIRIFGVVFGLHQALKEIFCSLTAKCSTMFVSHSLCLFGVARMTQDGKNCKLEIMNSELINTP